MNHKKPLLLVLCVGLGVALWLLWGRDPAAASVQAALPSESASGALGQGAPTPSTLGGLPGYHEPTKEELAQLAPAFDRLSAEDKKTVLETVAYQDFQVKIRSLLETTDLPRVSKAEVANLSKEIDFFKQQSYLIPYEAYQMKARLTSGAYSGAELEGKLAELKAQFSAEYKALWEKSDPSKDPTFMAFKSAQNAMIASTAQMPSFPDGLTRDEYIVRESDRIRSQYYK